MAVQGSVAVHSYNMESQLHQSLPFYPIVNISTNPKINVSAVWYGVKIGNKAYFVGGGKNVNIKMQYLLLQTAT